MTSWMFKQSVRQLNVSVDSFVLVLASKLHSSILLLAQNRWHISAKYIVTAYFRVIYRNAFLLDYIDTYFSKDIVLYF